MSPGDNLLVKAFAIYAELEGMKAEDREREVAGHSPANLPEDYFKLADRLNKLSAELDRIQETDK